ncbi:MAG: PhoH family protein [Bacteroidaceae bacterium]|nr:PhoH family protein [Bacteroidaceae bacterium]
MTEKHLILEDVDPASFYGAGNANLHLLKALLPKLRIVARGDVMKVMGQEEELEEFETLWKNLVDHLQKRGALAEKDIIDIFHGRSLSEEEDTSVILYSTSGKPVSPRSQNQSSLVKAYSQHDLIFAIGPAGTGKTFISIALAVRALKHREIKRIILSRPAVEAGEKLGFLPGDMKDKIDPYLQPLYDALEEMIPAIKLQEYMDRHVIQIAPLAFMRGRTLNDAVVILDEAQNTTTSQMKMFLTRMGMNTKMIITGDRTQVDLPPSQKSGLTEALRILKDVEGIATVEMTEKDIVRHKLVTRIVEAYGMDAQMRKEKVTIS